jgi:hypothetical protein
VAAAVNDHDIDSLFRNYFTDVNRLLRRHGYPVIDDVQI